MKLLAWLKEYFYFIVILGIALIFIVVTINMFSDVYIRHNDLNRTEQLIQDSINSHIKRDSLKMEYRLLQEKIDAYNRLDSLRKQEYDKLLKGNSNLTRDSLRRLFTGT